jgi:hypothetical protein
LATHPLGLHTSPRLAQASTPGRSLAFVVAHSRPRQITSLLPPWDIHAEQARQSNADLAIHADESKSTRRVTPARAIAKSGGTLGLITAMPPFSQSFLSKRRDTGAHRQVKVKSRRGLRSYTIEAMRWTKPRASTQRAKRTKALRPSAEGPNDVPIEAPSLPGMLL